MSKKPSLPTTVKLTRWYRGADVPLKVIRQFARDVASRFEADKIILFGSHAYGKPHADSDVDILVVMPARHEIEQAVRIDRAIAPLFPLDLIVCTPEEIGLATQGRRFVF